MNLRQLFAPSLVARAHEPGIEWAGVTYAFGELDARSNRLAQALRQRGLGAGDRMSIYLSNSLEMIELYLAAIKLGVIFVPINILYREREITHILGDAAPKLHVVEATLAELRAEAARASDDLPAVPLDGDAPAAIVYTSGTTGTAKGAILTHNNMAANGITLSTVWQFSTRDRLLLALPLFHVHALGNGIHCWLVSGCRLRLLERFEHQKAAAQMLDFAPTVFFGVPTMYVRLMDVAPDQARRIGEQMRLFVCGSAPLPAHLHDAFRERFGHTILERYGMTETLIITSNPYVGERRPGSVGLPLPGVSVRLSDDGELLVKGPSVFTGYWRREEATRDSFIDGWLRTGDIGTRADDGYYTLSGRRSDLIISGGYNIYPREIEELLLEHPQVAEAAVVAEPDRVRGEVPVAYVVSRGAVEPSALEAHLRDKLASFKVPRRFELVDALPRNALGKVQKHLLGPRRD